MDESIYTTEYDMITNCHKITGIKYVPPKRESKLLPKSQIFNNEIKKIKPSLTFRAKKEIRPFNIISNKYWKDNNKKKFIDQNYLIKMSSIKMQNDAPINTITQKYKSKKQEIIQQNKNENEIKNKVNQNKNYYDKSKNFLKFNPNLNTNPPIKSEYLNNYTGCKHPEIHHISTSKNLYKKQPTLPKIDKENKLKRNHDIITNMNFQPFSKPGNIVPYLGSDTKLKHSSIFES